jgi:hypothetical protein
MVQLVLKETDFENNKFDFFYGNREALFTIIDEEFAGHNRLGRINRMNVLVRKNGRDGQMCTTVIGYGDGIVGVRTDIKELRGKLLTKDNMSSCVVELFEDGDAGAV